VPELPPYDVANQTDDNPIVNIAAGTKHNLAVSRSGHVYSWGYGSELIATALTVLTCRRLAAWSWT
jgi:alpha-tubulin suppressor-like RCC1 family protein